MTTVFAHSPDGLRIAYDRAGSGPAVLLLHGGGSNREVWHEFGYVGRLSQDRTVITLDLRGHGESDLPTDPAEYTTDKMGGDILAVADACGIERFTIWGMSYGGKVGRYLAAQSDRVTKIIIMGIPFGPAVTAEMRQQIEAFCIHWPPIIEAQRDGTLDLDSLSEDDREFLGGANVPVIMAWGRAMIDWPSIEPADVRCPALWLVGSEDEPAMASVREYEDSLKDSDVQLHIVEGLDHPGVLMEIDRVFGPMLAFTQS
jgi:pimeloyl-ACP methyl ester carboxylesterase